METAQAPKHSANPIWPLLCKLFAVMIVLPLVVTEIVKWLVGM